MQRLVRVVALGLGLGMLAACGPVYQTDYHMVPPQDAMGRQCSSTCIERAQGCKSQCQTLATQCQYTAELEAKNAYLEYVTRRQAEGMPIKKSQDDFYSYSSCADPDDCKDECDATHRLCHTNCGGQVLERTYCTAFCEGQ